MEKQLEKIFRAWAPSALVVVVSYDTDEAGELAVIDLTFAVSDDLIAISDRIDKELRGRFDGADVILVRHGGDPRATINVTLFDDEPRQLVEEFGTTIVQADN